MPQKAMKGQAMTDILAEHPDPKLTKLYPRRDRKSLPDPDILRTNLTTILRWRLKNGSYGKHCSMSGG